MSDSTHGRIGVAGLNEDHHRRWGAGLASFAEIGTELGVKPQTVHKAFKHRGWTRTNAPAVEPVKPVGPSKPDERLTEPEREKMSNVAHKRILMGAMVLADEATTGLQAARGKHSASSLNAYGRVLRQAAELLTGLLYPTGSEERECLTELRVRVLTDEEHDNLKRKGERGGKDDFDDLEEDSFDDPDEDDSEKVVGPGVAVGTCIARPVDPNMPAASTESVPKDAAPASGWALTALPDRNGFRSWLMELADQRGKRFVRELAAAVSGRELGVGVDLDHAIAVVEYGTGGDPMKLKSLLDKISATA